MRCHPGLASAAVIWDALKAACEADHETAKTIIHSADIIVSKPDMSVCYDERGARPPKADRKRGGAVQPLAPRNSQGVRA